MPYGGAYVGNVMITTAGALRAGDRFRVVGGTQYFVALTKKGLASGKEGVVSAVLANPSERFDNAVIEDRIKKYCFSASDVGRYKEYLSGWQEEAWLSGVFGIEIENNISVWKSFENEKEREEKGMEREVKNPDYKERMLREYHEVKDRYVKLHKMLVRHDAGKLDFRLNCPVEILKMQKKAMGQYLYILEVRAEIEGIDLRRLPVGRE